MQYHIVTGLILDKFKERDGCPLCAIEEKVELGLLNEFLADACMDDAVRMQVNKLGFCAAHYDALFALPSKLGLALQTDTRMNKLRQHLSMPDGTRSAKKHAQKIERELSTCIICDYVEEEMEKYYKTVAQMYARESEFREMLPSVSFCLKHYAMLLNFSDFALLKAKDYLSAINEAERAAFDRVQKNVEAFAAHHDYRRISSPMGEEKDALKETRRLLYGKKSRY